MVNPFYAGHLTRLMDTGAEENVIPQLYDWVSRKDSVMTLAEFKSCVDLMLDRVEQMAIEEQPMYDPIKRSQGAEA